MGGSGDDYGEVDDGEMAIDVPGTSAGSGRRCRRREASVDDDGENDDGR